MDSNIQKGAEEGNGWQRQMQEKLRETENIVTRWLPEETGHQRLIFQAMNYSVLAGGKRLRPMLMKEVYRLFGGQGEEIEPFMAAIEMIHTSSLVHDDLPAMDADEYRRGKKTTWVVYGEDMAILAGDALMIYAFEVASKAFGLAIFHVLKCVFLIFRDFQDRCLRHDRRPDGGCGADRTSDDRGTIGFCIQAENRGAA